ncbi:malate synthase A [uncultured Ferrimonas sp.]|uniref:malate synthase A n=1 Tax=uncultured Ferrimonas sp. TaxID=432640 RepID=UPI002632B5D5|nr:malate synthase A [uncultured Ferrimonas sp.]
MSIQSGHSAIEIIGPEQPESAAILSAQALQLVEELAQRFNGRRDELLQLRLERQAQIDAGKLPDFLAETAAIRRSDWQILGIPADLQDRRVEITGPVERKMVINALNADVKIFMADFEDSLAPAWDKVIQGQANLRDAINRHIDFTHPDSGKRYELRPDPAVLIARVRGLHLDEVHLNYQGQPIAGALVDFALYFYHNHQQLLANGSGPYFYIPKLQSHLEARWWAEVFAYTEERFGLQPGTIKATCLIETLPAVFEMDEILYELRNNIVGLNCGRWDYIFSYIKTLRNHPDRVLPDRQAVTMDKPFLNAYSRLLIKTCHRRGALAMGGMAAFIPAKDPAKQQAVLAKVHADKELEAKNGHDGTWIAHPGLADTAMAVMDQYLGESPNQMSVSRDQDAPITAAELLQPCAGEATEQGMRANIRIAVQYVEAWISGNGCVPIYGLMEDAATAEISRSSIWQWIKHGTHLDNGQLVTVALFEQMLQQELQVVREELGAERYDHGRFDEASELFRTLTSADQLTDFLTLPGYQVLTRQTVA